MFVSPLPLIIYSKNLRMTLNFEKLFNKISYKIKYDNCIYLGHLGYMLFCFFLQFFFVKCWMMMEHYFTHILTFYFHKSYLKHLNLTSI